MPHMFSSRQKLYGSVMSETEQLSALIDDIYDAALDPSLWVHVLQSVAEFVCTPVGAQASGLLARDGVRKHAARKSANGHDGSGVDPHFTQLQPEQYPKLEPTGSTLFLLGTGRALSATEFMPGDESRATRYDEVWAPPQGVVDCVHAMHATLDKWATGAAHMSVLRNEASGL